MTAKKVVTWAVCILYTVGLAYLVYDLFWIHNDTVKEAMRRNAFTEQCEASGNHMEIHNDDKGVPHYGCYEAPKAKLIKEFE